MNYDLNPPDTIARALAWGVVFTSLFCLAWWGFGQLARIRPDWADLAIKLYVGFLSASAFVWAVYTIVR